MKRDQFRVQQLGTGNKTEDRTGSCSECWVLAKLQLCKENTNSQQRDAATHNRRFRNQMET
jgi:hypothetical protein